MALTKIGPSGFDNITTDKIATDAITEAKIADTAVENEHLNTNIITGQSEISEKGAVDDVLLVYDTSTGTLKKITAANINLGAPTITSITPTNVDSKDSATTTTFTVTGTNFFTGTTAKLISNSASDISFTTVTRDSTTQLTCVLSNALITAEGITDEPYDIFVNNGISTVTLTNQIFVDQRPVFVTAAGSLGSVTEDGSASFTVEATDPESAGAVRYDVVGGSLPSGLSLNTATGAITGTAPLVAADTTSTFTIQASDVDSNVSLREFSITVTNVVIETFTSSGTFSVPVGKTSVDVLVVAGGGAGGTHHGAGGGAGGLIFRPGFPVTPGGTVSVTVGCGGGGPNNFPAPDNPNGQQGASGQDTVFGTLTAKGGGGAGAAAVSRSGKVGGSGGGSGAPGPSIPGGAATQPTQPGDSGTYGFGNPGGANGGGCGPTGGGGGAGAVGGTSSPVSGNGGAGKSYTIADGTTPVFYAGGGGGSWYQSGPVPANKGLGGQGGGGDGGSNAEANFPARQGAANRGGGGGGADRGPTCTGSGGAGGKGIVIVKY